MAVSRVSLSSITQGFPKSRSFLDGNSAYIPSSFESIATATPTSGTTVTFSSIPSTYKHLQIRANIVMAAGNAMTYSVNSSGTGYAWHDLEGNGTSASATGAATQAAISMTVSTAKSPTTYPTVFILDISDYASTSKTKTFRSVIGSNDNTTSAARGITLGSGLWNNTSAITSITFTGDASGAFAAGTTFALYGIKG